MGTVERNGRQNQHSRGPCGSVASLRLASEAPCDAVSPTCHQQCSCALSFLPHREPPASQRKEDRGTGNALRCPFPVITIYEFSKFNSQAEFGVKISDIIQIKIVA